VAQPGSMNEPQSTSKNTTAAEITGFDPDIKFMIDTWPQGPSTNGFSCALQFVRPAGDRGLLPICYVNIINATTNMVRSGLNLPREVLLQVDLYDAVGKAAEKTSAGKLFSPWTPKEIDDWFHKQVQENRRGRFFGLFPFSYTQINCFRVPEVFQLKTPGLYTLHVRMPLIQSKADASGNVHLETLWLPEVVTAIQIRPEDISSTAGAAGLQTNSPPPH